LLVVVQVVVDTLERQVAAVELVDIEQVQNL
jgi:hypothetical protein